MNILWLNELYEHLEPEDYVSHNLPNLLQNSKD